MSKVYVIHENDDWLAPLRQALADYDVPFREWHLATGNFSMSEQPPDGIFYNRMSASSHTRGHRHAPEYTACVLAWLASHGRRIVNGPSALELELSKVRQYAALEAAGVRTPRTAVACGRDAVLEAAHRMDGPMILKPNRGGKGTGVHLFATPEAVEAHLDGPDFAPGPDGVVLLQQFIESPDRAIVRAEFVGGNLLYAVRVDTSDGFELCPADACSVGDRACPVGDAPEARFRILPGWCPPHRDLLEAFLAANGIEVAGVEMIFDAAGTVWTYDVNTNTNYNPDAEATAGLAGTDRAGMRAVARFLKTELQRLPARAAAA